jgi:hypothetical protein
VAEKTDEGNKKGEKPMSRSFAMRKPSSLRPLLLVAALLLSTLSPAQSSGSMCWHDTATSIQWTNSYLGRKVLDVHVDPKGNTYVGGYNYENYNGDKWNMFIEKFDRNGNLLWLKQQSPQQYSPNDNYKSSFCSAIASDREGNIYLTGTFGSQKFMIDSQVINNPNTYSQGYIAKLDSNGTARWMIHQYYASQQGPWGGADILFSDPDRLFVSIIGNGTFTFADGSNQVLPGGDEFHVLEIDTAGKYIDWWAAFGTNGGGAQTAYNPDPSIFYSNKSAVVSPKLQRLSNGRIALVGTFMNFMNMYTNMNITAVNTGENGFIAILDTSLGWVKVFRTYGTADNYQPGSGLTSPDIIPAAATDTSGNIYIAVRWGGAGASSMDINNQIQPDPRGGLVAKYNQNGSLQWYNPNGFSFIRSLDRNGNNEIAFFGEFPDSVRIRSQNRPDTVLTSAGSTDLFWGSYNPSGDPGPLWKFGSAGTERAFFMDNFDCTGNLYFAAVQNLGCSFQNDTFPNGGDHGLIAKFSFNQDCYDTLCPPPQYTAPSNGQGVAENLQGLAPVLVYPLPALDLVQVSFPFSQKITASVLNTLGKICLETRSCTFCDHLSLGTEALAPGIYFLELKDEHRTYIARFIKAGSR